MRRDLVCVHKVHPWNMKPLPFGKSCCCCDVTAENRYGWFSCE
jgi:hypothetical protein